MELPMPPPLKRRKLFDFMWRGASTTEAERSEDDTITAIPLAEPSAVFAHDIETLSYLTLPQRVEEVHLHIQQRAVADMDEVRALQPRQGTAVSTPTSSAASSTASSDTASSAGTSSATGSGTAVTSVATSTASTGSSVSPTVSAESTTFSASGTSVSGSAASSSGASSSAASSSAAASSAVGTNITSTESAASSRTDSSSATSAPSSTIISSGTNLSSPSTTASQLLTATSSQAALFVATGSSTNSTTSISASSGSSSSAVTLTTSFAGNLSTTVTSHSSSTTQSAFIFLATLANGSVEALSQSSSEYITTLEDGEVFTIPALSASTTTDTSSTASTTDSSSSSSDDPASSTKHAVTSIAYITTSMDVDGTEVPQTITSIATINPAGAAGQAATAASSSASPTSTSLSSGGDNNSNTPPAAAIAGGVIGGLAGLAIMLLIAAAIIRWKRRRAQMGHHALPPNTFLSPDPSASAPSSSGPGMAERAGLRPLAAAVPGLFRHQDRSLTDPSETSERGFTKVSGRKLPSQFSPGMSAVPPGMPLTAPERNFSASSFYRDSYGGEGESPPEAGGYGAAGGMPTVSQGPQRRPTIHHAVGPYAISPESSEGWSSPPGTAATFGDSITSLDPRGSRFNEEL